MKQVNLEVLKWYRKHRYEDATDELKMLDTGLKEMIMRAAEIRHERKVLGKKYNTSTPELQFISEQLQEEANDLSRDINFYDWMIEREIQYCH